MFSSKRGEYFSLFSNLGVIYGITVVIFILLNSYTVAVYAPAGLASATTGRETTEMEPTPADHIEKLCVEKCPDQNRTNVEHLDCGENCYKSQCAAGCKLWEIALDSSCKAACNKTEQDEDLYCVMGCNNALNQYFKWLSDEVGILSAPALLADSLTATSLSLEWEGGERLAEFTKGRSHITRNYLVQWRYEESGNDWKFCRNQSMGDNSTIRVDNLQPFTKYRFRVALILSSNREMELYSEQSLVISTLAQGPPLSAPVIVRAVAVDHTRISISWEPGLFPNGPILFYVLQIKESNRDGYLAFKDIPATEKDYLVEKLTPSTEYSVSLKMRNAFGEGPAAMSIIITTEEPAIRPDDENLKLIIASDYRILLQGSNYFYDTPNFIYNSTEAIVGIGIHVAKKLIFITDETRVIYRAPLDSSSMINREIIYSMGDTKQIPLALSVDWLNNKLYILFEIDSIKMWQISRCDFNGRLLQVVYGGLQIKPTHFEVDPFNGYLFWSVSGRSGESGLFRLDLSDISNGVKHEISPTAIFLEYNVGVFTIDYVRFKILVPIEDINTVIAIDLDGRRYEDIRKNTQSPLFSSVKSIAMANNIFYWTNGEAILNEEYHNQNKLYYHNVYYDFAQVKNFLFVCLKLPSAQPIPIPVNPPSNVQALLSMRRGKVSWHVPHLLGIQGKGAWQDWTYEIEIVDEDNDDGDNKRMVRNIKGLHYGVTNLTSNTKYRFRVAAYTDAGIGPYSTEFRAQTLTSPHDRFLIWASHDGLVQSDVLGDHIHVLIPRQKLDFRNITNIAWFEDVLFFVCNHSLHYYNRTSGVAQKLDALDAVQTVAVDWIGRRLYWFNPSHQMITRGNLNGYEQEPLIPLSARETDIQIDSLRGFLYFSTGHSVEFCRLNGKQKREYYRMEAYSGKQVMGLTLDMDKQRVYWIVRGYDGSSLISAPMAGTSLKSMQTEEHILSEKRIQGPLTYFSDRLLWLQDDRTVIISNLTGKNLAHIKNIKLNELKAFSVIDPTQHILPETQDPLNVVPEHINSTSIRVSGQWNAFRITWEPISKVNYGEVFYEVRYQNNTVTESKPFVQIENEHFVPYTPIDISIRAFTYWASSKVVKSQVFSPAAAPTEPSNPRVFVSHLHDPIHGGVNIEAIFRWNQPHALNGPLVGYKITGWFEENNLRYYLFDKYHLQPETNEKSFESLTKNTTYYLQVKAITIAGEGNYTDVISFNTQSENPIPNIFVASDEEIFLVDLDLNKITLIVNAGSEVKHLSYIAFGKHLFWINENNELMALRQSNKKKLHSINGTVTSITVDWIERVIYWSQLDASGSSINAFNLNTLKTTVFLRCDGIVYSLNAAPLNRQLLWIESENEAASKGHLMSYQLDENRLTEFRDAVDSTIIAFHKTLLLDTFAENDEQLLWLNKNNELISTGIRSKLSHSLNFSYSTDMIHLVKDSGRLYWSQKDTIYAENYDNQSQYEVHFAQLTKMLALYHQNYPSIHCLIPRRHFAREHNISLLESYERALILHLPSAKLYENCPVKPMELKYTVMYKPVTGENNHQCSLATCKFIETYDRIAEIKDLAPYTKYQFQISVSNFYAEMKNVSMHFGPTFNFTTKTGAPTPPRNVSAETISPTEANVRWLPPIELNGESVWYEVQWQTQNAINGVKNQQQLLVSDQTDFEQTEDSLISINITKLMPNQPYNVWVRAYTTNVTYNQSFPVKIITLPEPEDITLIGATSKTLTINWKPYANALRYVMEYRPVDYDKFSSEIIVDSSIEQETEDVIKLLHLHPKTQYIFWISLYFPKRQEPYFWPQDRRFIFETHGDRPDPPGKPIIVHVRGDVYKVTWTAASSNGAAIEEYSLEALRYRASNRAARSTDLSAGEENTTAIYATSIATATPLAVEEFDPIADKWTEYYSGNDTYWIIKDLTPINLYSFRVRARNSYGWGEFSKLSDPITEPFISSDHRDYLLFVIAGPVFVTVLIILFACIICAFRRKASDKKMFQEAAAARIDVELANLRDLPRHANFIQSNNILYSIGPITDVDIALLPQIRRDQITMASFLGSGAFGEVYEGCVTNVGNEPETRVAIKTLRKGATEQEKGEFLQEAQLMSNFKHKHILRLIGVCFDMDALYIIMELMQGGDLLSFLRQSRPCEGTPSALTLLDLMSMCVDIAAGCRYLEEMHFVHRDLACRNCLVSSVDPENRVVKIGDFGLARDIYKNDYYRKDGEGLLPVRWMSPESLVDGVFTSQSDIWAFGVLCWEIMTLGQQPYPARTNLEVLQYVRDKGRLDRPANCPENVYQLMLKCWSFRPEERPTFRYCLEVLQILRNNCEAVHINVQSLQQPASNGGIFNRSYLLADENHNHEQDIIKYTNAVDALHVAEPYILAKTATPNIPKYLEIIYNENEDEPPSVLCSPYETPLPDLDNQSATNYSCNSSEFNVQNDKDKNSYNLELSCNNKETATGDRAKERTFSSSSTVSEASVYCSAPPPPPPPPPPSLSNLFSKSQKQHERQDEQSQQTTINNNNNSLASNVILTVTLPNSKEDCKSDEQLLTQQIHHTVQHDIENAKLRQLYANANANVHECVLNCDGITSM